MSELRSIPTSQLRLDPRNPRIRRSFTGPPLYFLLQQERPKIYPLALDIAQNGLSPIELFIAMESETEPGAYVVLEGNRRTCALMILHNPSLAEGFISSVRLRTLRQASASPLVPQEVECRIMSREEAAKWISRRHGGEQEGKGTVNWEPRERTTFQVDGGGTPDSTLQVMEFLEGHGVSDTDSVKFTNLSRFIESPTVCELLGLRFVDGVMQTVTGQYETVRRLSRLLDALRTEGVNSRTANKTDDLVNTVEALRLGPMVTGVPFPLTSAPLEQKPEAQAADDRTSGANPSDTEGAHTEAGDSDPACARGEKDQGSSEAQADAGAGDSTHKADNSEGGPERDSANAQAKPAPKVRQRRLSTARSTLIPPSFSLDIDRKRVNQIFRELKSLKLDKHPNAIAVLFRVFLELSLDAFVIRNHCGGPDQKLPVKGKAACDELQTREKWTEKQAMAYIQFVTSAKKDINSVDWLHAYVHSLELAPSSTELKFQWDRLEEFFSALWKR